MHRCLFNFEILQNICTFLQEAELLSFALTCKDIEPAAINTLWRHLSCLGHIIRSFPHDKWAIETHFSYERKVKYFLALKPLSRQDWDHVLPYLPKIRSLSLAHEEQVSDKLLEGMLASFPGTTMFPLLCRLIQQKDGTDTMLEFIGSIIGPKLEYLDITMSSENSTPIRTHLLSTLSASCPSMKTFRLEQSDAVLPAIPASICHWNTLQVLVVPALTEDALIHVSQLPELRHLSFGLANFKSTSGSQFPSIPLPAFPRLEHIFIHQSYIPFALTILRAIRSPSYHSFWATLLGHISPAEWKALFTQLSNFPSKGLLIEIMIDYVQEAGSGDSATVSAVITPDVFRCLFPAGSHISVLELASIIVPDLDDELILDLVKACPTLTSIVLGTDWSSGHHSNATLMSYAHIVQYCPKIETIGLVVDASGVDTDLPLDPIQEIQRLPSCPFFHFLVGNSQIDEPAPVAAFLSSLLSPSIETIYIEVAHECPEEIQEKWEAVEKLLPLFLATRAQESLRTLRGIKAVTD